MSRRTRPAATCRKLTLEVLEGRLAPAAHTLIHDSSAAADQCVASSLGYADNGPIRPLLAAVAVVGLCVAWDHKVGRIGRHHQLQAH